MLTGNREFNEIYEKYKNLVLKAAYIYSGNNYDVAEDITQDTFLKLYTKFDDLKGGNLSAWLFTTAKNAALNYKKKHDREILSVDDEEYTDDEPYRESTEEEYAENELERERARLHDRIFQGLMEKNPRWYEAVFLAYYMEIPQEKVAQMMDIRLGVLHSILHRAKKWIRKTYGVEYEEMNRKE
ncbi:sigma-70 family RNA polymerase sigma factor [Mediterraneibacter catenae]|jgi:RNA polymerase sigma-70 factor (ECF subfamily)|uniref:Sigma-70 family RNA polymerase sigma factor n=1 Tax=Mediterraneibacter catenae TaxID=2594882 RepID=A0A5M9HXV9_9FIRM|nr:MULTISPECIES: sigma-70 family RNA polymerase sigma factor [Mediterraneibacter]KAA8501517.1 sigma-70 family RNA polymerase sigma factor [Mediterraneibacter catenae]MCF2569424.1 sigma-70 family RNA polymerase sigma factor [Mediterraneibacter glycyrrhizinilyticus]OUO31430.1 RNA polymerase subunit sigma-70 [Lachnoclostridium sp. An298]